MSRHHRKTDGTGWNSSDLKTWKPRIGATLPQPCVDCGHLISPELPDNKWQVGHIVPLWAGGTKTADNLGPSHSNGSGPRGRSCNQSAGGRMGRAIQLAAKKKDRRLPPW